MSAALDVLERARHSGVKVEVVGDRLRLRSPRKPPDDVLAELLANKPGLIALLSGMRGLPAYLMIDDFDERAAIIEEGAGVPREWAEGYARLLRTTPPQGFTDQQWQRLIDDGGAFLDRWGAEAARVGWSAIDAFGVLPSPDMLNHRPLEVDQLPGLVPLIGGGEATAIDKDHVTIRRRSGAELVYLRRGREGAVALWELRDDHADKVKQRA